MRVARVGDPAPFDFPGLYRSLVYSLVALAPKSHKIPLRMHQNSPFSDKKFLRRENSTSDCGRDPASSLDHFKHWFTLRPIWQAVYPKFCTVNLHVELGLQHGWRNLTRRLASQDRSWLSRAMYVALLRILCSDIQILQVDDNAWVVG